MEHVRLYEYTIPCSESVSDRAEATSFSLSSCLDILCAVSKQMGELALSHSEGCLHREDRGPRLLTPSSVRDVLQELRCQNHGHRGIII